MTSTSTTPVPRNQHVEEVVDDDAGDMSPRERARALADALNREAAWFDQWSRDVFRYAPIHGDKAQEAKALGKSCGVLARRAQSWANT